MESIVAKTWLRSMILQRQMLVRTEQSQRNRALMVKLCEKLKKELAYFNPKGDKVFSFIRTRYVEILLIIPGNKNAQHNLDILKQIYLCDLQKKNSLPSTSVASPTQLQLSL